MKEGFKECPFCANEIKERAIKCQYCGEFLLEEKKEELKKKVKKEKKEYPFCMNEINIDKNVCHFCDEPLDDLHYIEHGQNNNLMEVNKVKGTEEKRNWGIVFVLILPTVSFIWLLFSFLSVLYLYGTEDTTSLDIIRNIFNRLLGILAIIGLIGFIPGLVMLVKLYPNYNPNISLKTKPSDLYDIYKSFFDINLLPKSDIDEMKHNGFISKFKVVWAVILNIITLGYFSIFYYGAKHNDLPKIKGDDFTAGKGIGYLFIPFYNLYWVCVFWLRLVDRINFQYTIRNKKRPISRGLTIAFLICNYIPYLNILSIVIIGSILVGQIQKAVNGLVLENEK